MASKYIVTQVDPAGGGTVTRTENIVDRTERFDTLDYYNEWRYHWNCDTLQANPAPGYVFDHWNVSYIERWYDGIEDPTGKSPFSWEGGPYAPSGPFNNPIVITIQDGQTYPDRPFNNSPPGYIELDAYVPKGTEVTISPVYYRPAFENIWTFTAVFRKVSPTYTHLPVYSITQNKLMYHTTANKLLRDSP